MRHKGYTIITKNTDGEWAYIIRGYGHKETSNKKRVLRTMIGYATELQAQLKAKDVIELKIKEGKWKEQGK